LRRACIDIGSNTTRLLVADWVDGDLVELRQERAFTQIGTSLDAQGRIPVAKLAEVLAVVRAQVEIARELGAHEVCCVATAGVRRAGNSDQLVELIAGACDGLETRVLTGAEEARLAFTGAAWAAGSEAAGAALAVVDAGGGSCELAVGEWPDRVGWWASLPIGSADVTAGWLRSDPPTRAQLDRARDQVRASFERLRPAAAQRVIAVGGGATSLRAVAGAAIDRDGFARLFALIGSCGAAELSGRFGVDVKRARLLAGGLVILQAVSELFEAPLELGRGGLREGLLLSPALYQ
jgi:exopolyphosphatase / guanosine-5'-triphosphate,3'-diphosphate pyrophosphatase